MKNYYFTVHFDTGFESYPVMANSLNKALENLEHQIFEARLLVNGISAYRICREYTVVSNGKKFQRKLQKSILGLA